MDFLLQLFVNQANSKRNYLEAGRENKMSKKKKPNLNKSLFFILLFLLSGQPLLIQWLLFLHVNFKFYFYCNILKTLVNNNDSE